MASNTFGSIFKITTWGESHGPAIGVVVDGCPAGLALSEDNINEALARRAPGRAHTSPRKEPDSAEILSGVFEGQTTGAPISILIRNLNAKSQDYNELKDTLRPGHANYTYSEKYGVFDYRGGGRASARETACRVAAGAIASQLLKHVGIEVVAYLTSVGNVAMDDTTITQQAVNDSPVFCPQPNTCERMREAIDAASQAGDSIGGVVAFQATGLPIGLGDPVYEKLEAKLAHAMLSIPASKGFEIGEGFGASAMQGSEHNDAFIIQNGIIQTQTNKSGGLLGGISTGSPLFGRVAFKPTSSIKKPQQTTDLQGNEKILELSPSARHDPCVAVRAVPVVEAMLALVLADAVLLNRCATL